MPGSASHRHSDASLRHTRVSLQSEQDFAVAIDEGRLVSVTTPGSDLPAEYPDDEFAPADIFPLTPSPETCIGDPDGGLVMAWGDSNDTWYYAQWRHIYDQDPNLVGQTVIAVALPPLGVKSVSMAIFDAAGAFRCWT